MLSNAAALLTMNHPLQQFQGEMLSLLVNNFCLHFYDWHETNVHMWSTAKEPDMLVGRRSMSGAFLANHSFTTVAATVLERIVIASSSLSCS
jgi:hypothetical protein